MSSLRPFNIKIKTTSKYEGKERKENQTIHISCRTNRLQQLSFSSIVAYMYLKVALRISELESTENLSSPYIINLSIRAFERFGKSYGCYVEFTLSRRSVLHAS